MYVCIYQVGCEERLRVSEPTGTGKPVEAGQNNYGYGNGTQESHSVELVPFPTIPCFRELFRTPISRNTVHSVEQNSYR